MSTKAREAFWNVALGNNTKLANLAKLAIKEAEDAAQPKEPLTDEQIDAIGFSVASKSDFPSIQQFVPFGDELKPYVCEITRAIEAAHGIKE